MYSISPDILVRSGNMYEFEFSCRPPGGGRSASLSSMEGETFHWVPFVMRQDEFSKKCGTLKLGSNCKYPKTSLYCDCLLLYCERGLCENDNIIKEKNKFIYFYTLIYLFQIPDTILIFNNIYQISIFLTQIFLCFFTPKKLTSPRVQLYLPVTVNAKLSLSFTEALRYLDICNNPVMLCQYYHYPTLVYCCVSIR